MPLPQDIRPVNSELMDSLAQSSKMQWIETDPGQAWMKVLWIGAETGPRGCQPVLRSQASFGGHSHA